MIYSTVCWRPIHTDDIMHISPQVLYFYTEDVRAELTRKRLEYFAGKAFERGKQTWKYQLGKEELANIKSTAGNSGKSRHYGFKSVKSSLGRQGQ